MSISNNTTKLQSLMDKINALPEASGGGSLVLPPLDNAGTSEHLLKGKQLIDQNCNVVDGAMPNNGAINKTFDGINNKSYTIPLGYTSGGTVSLDDTIDDEADAQADIINQIATVLNGKAVGGSGGSSNPSASTKAVNFRDYDGTILYSYTKDEALSLTALPALPTRQGLTCQGWNWSLEDMKSYVTAYGRLEIGATYITDDGKTRIYITLQEGKTSPMLGVCPNGTVTVDWGDGSTSTLTGTSAGTVKWTPTHNYARAGDYVITLSVNGSMGFYGASGSHQYSGILRYSSSSDSRNYVYQNAVQKIEIGSNVTSIGYGAFYYCYSLSSITIPSSVTSISGYAFNCCYSLSSITIPNGVKSIGTQAFKNCFSLTSITIPNGVTSIGDYAFNNCYSLTSITIPSSVTRISDSAFYYCYSLTSITIPNGVTSIGNGPFYYCFSLTSITIPNGVTSIGPMAFQNCYGMAFYDFTSHTSVPTLSNKNAFTGIPSDCQIRVPAALYDEWIAAANWSTYASQIVAV